MAGRDGAQGKPGGQNISAGRMDPGARAAARSGDALQIPWRSMRAGYMLQGSGTAPERSGRGSGIDPAARAAAAPERMAGGAAVIRGGSSGQGRRQDAPGGRRTAQRIKAADSRPERIEQHDEAQSEPGGRDDPPRLLFFLQGFRETVGGSILYPRGIFGQRGSPMGMGSVIRARCAGDVRRLYAKRPYFGRFREDLAHFAAPAEWIRVPGPQRGPFICFRDSEKLRR